MERKKNIIQVNNHWNQTRVGPIDNKKYLYYAKYTISRTITVLKDRGKTVGGMSWEREEKIL